jgi:hypothetical protein
MARKDAQPGVKEVAAERRVQALELRKAGASYRAIAAQLNISEKTAHQDVQRALRALAEIEHASAEEYRTMELLRLDALTLEASRILRATHPLISGGKVLSGFTVDGKAIGLTDDGPKLQAIDRLLRIAERRARLLGLDMQLDADLPADLAIILRWADGQNIIDVTPDNDRHASPTPQIAESDSAAPGALPMHLRWETMGEVETSSDVEPEDGA